MSKTGPKSFLEKFIESGQSGAKVPTRSKNLNATRSRLIRQKEQYPGGDKVSVVTHEGSVFLVNHEYEHR